MCVMLPNIPYTISISMHYESFLNYVFYAQLGMNQQDSELRNEWIQTEWHSHFLTCLLKLKTMFRDANSKGVVFIKGFYSTLCCCCCMEIQGEILMKTYQNNTICWTCLIIYRKKVFYLNFRIDWKFLSSLILE